MKALALLKTDSNRGDFQDISGCNTSPVEGADSGDSSLLYLCNALSREDGTFSFPSLASGEYTVVSIPCSSV